MTSSQLFLLSLIAVVVVFGMFVILAAGSRGQRARFERKSLMTKRELEFFKILCRVLPEHNISCQVAMGALLNPRKGSPKKEFWRARGMISQKIVDFAVIDPGTGIVQALIELDDRTHLSAKDAKRDAMLDEGQYRVVRFSGRVTAMEQTVREKLHFLLEPSQEDPAPAPWAQIDEAASSRSSLGTARTDVKRLETSGG